MTKESFLNALLNTADLYVYERSVDQAGDTCAAMVRRGLEKLIAVKGPDASAFEGEERDGIRYCKLTVPNAHALQALFPYTKPKSHKDHPFTMGVGDRLGLATPGHVRAIAGYNVYPIFAQQSMRELNLTGRSFEDVIAAASFGVFQEGYKGGFGADGDHLKTKEEIKYALDSGCTMITMDCSAKIDVQASGYTDEAVAEAYAKLPETLRAYYDDAYLNKELPVIGTIGEAELHRIVLVFYRAIDHAIDCYKYIEQIRTCDVDFELSIDETLTITTPAEHFVVANELNKADVRPISCAPHFSGEFQKGIEYFGNLNDFARDFVVHQKIADYFGYKLSLHSGSDKFCVFSTVGRVAQGHIHVKTAGTNWLEAMRIVAKENPELYRKAHKYAIEHRPEAEKYYHVSTNVNDIPNIDLQSDAYLPEYMSLPASRQTVHIAYGMLLSEPWFHDAFFTFMAEHEEQYYDALVAHIGKHLRYLTAEVK